ncbi:MAG TPA: GGDEF domain-containing protein [Thiomicrospira sp.]|nr:GGDEF domain-containing protein [Thiomicrospira sp.]
MIKTQDSPEQAREIYSKIDAIFNKHHITPLPINYLVWYHYFKGEHQALNTEMTSILKNPGQFTDRLGIRLYEQFLEQEEMEAENKYDFAVRQFVDDIIQKLSDWNDDLEHHSEQMGACALKLKNSESSSKDLEEIASYIAQTAMTMQSSTNQIREEVQNNSDEVNSLRQQLNEAKAEALKDELTQIGNRKAFNSCLMDLTIEHKSKPHSLCLIMTDIDHFKKFNDTYGHPVGDSVLRYFSNIMRKSSPENEVLCRYGGEEFAIIIKDCSIEEAAKRAEHIRTQIEAARLTLKDSDEPISTITASFGISHFKGHQDNLEEFIQRADQSLYKAKQSGRNQVIHELMSA